MIQQIDAEIISAGRAPGVRLRVSESIVDELESVSADWQTHRHISCLNFADDTYTLGATPNAVSYSAGVLAHKFATAGLILHLDKCERLDTTSLAPVYQDRQCPQLCNTPSLLMLGSQISQDPGQERAVTHHVQLVWQAWYDVQSQLRLRQIPLRLRCRLLHTTVVACLM